MPAFEADGARLHAAYVDAINSNVIGRVMALLSDDVVFQAPGEPELIGADAVREWGASFFDAFAATWEKHQHAFEVSGSLAISRYTYTGRFSGRHDGAVIDERGKGVVVYRRDEDDRWLIVLDSWSHDALTMSE